MPTSFLRSLTQRGHSVRRRVTAFRIGMGLLAALVIGSGFTFSSPAFAASGINKQISYHARLMDASGFPVSNGDYSVKFSLYDAETGGSRLWTAAGTVGAPSSVTVNVAAGLFTVLLGDDGQNPLEGVNWNSDTIYLGVTIGSDAEMTPRRRLASAAQAFNSNQLQGQSASGTAFGASSVFTINQTSNTEATGTRSALDVRSSGTSDANDLLIRGVNDQGTSVFTLNRQGSVTTTGQINALGSGTSTFSGSVSTTFANISQSLIVGGQLVCLANGTNCLGTSGSSLEAVSNIGASTTHQLYFFGGFMGASSTVTSTFTVLGTSNLQNVTATQVTTTYLYATTASSSALFASNATFATATVMGQAVCLENGVGCPATSQSDTLASVTDRGAFATSTLQLYGGFIGASSTVTSTFTVLGATTLGTLNGSDATFASVTSTSWFGFGSASGSTLNATSIKVNGVSVCLADGTNCLGATASTLQQITDNGATTTNQLHLVGGFVSGSTSTFLGNVGYGTSIPVTQLDVPGRIPLTQFGSVGTNSGSQSVFVLNKYAYVINYGADTLQVVDISVPSTPVVVGAVSTGIDPFYVYVQGKYAYVTNYSSASMQIIDVSNPASPSIIGTLNTLSNPTAVYVQGRYAYILNSSSDSLQIADISNPTVPTIVGAAGVGNDPFSVYVQGRYAYVVSFASNNLKVVDVSVPSSPAVVGTVSTASAPFSVYVQGQFAYVANYSASSLQIINISNPTSPTVVGSINTALTPFSVFVQGRYAFVTNVGSDSMQVFDVSSSTAPVVVGNVSTGLDPASVFVQGRYAYVANYVSNSLQVFDLGGAYLQQLEAGGIETGSLSVTNNIQAEDVSIHGGLTVGQSTNISGDLGVAGKTSVASLTFTNGTSSNWFGYNVASGTTLYATNAAFASATVLGSAVCLQTGANCPGSSDTLATVSARGSFATSTLQLYGGFIGASSTVTSTFTVLGATTLG
ncbi:MAG: hypothetical protein WCK01_05765, partial [Candidatus Uhrbacteria bacterium]